MNVPKKKGGSKYYMQKNIPIKFNGSSTSTFIEDGRHKLLVTGRHTISNLYDKTIHWVKM